tara:strand:- start:212 stop:766 length:555 start_codon:yes stop_codon:yes gene_type:complete
MSMFGGFAVGKFVSEIVKSGVAYNHRYEMIYGATRSGELIFDRETQEKLNSRLESVSLPGSVIGSNPVKLQGIDREMPYGRLYEGDLKVIYLEDRDFNIRKSFEAWQRRIVDETTYHVGFYDDYVCDSVDISMSPLNKDEEVYKVRIFGLFPKTISAIELSGAGGDSVIKTEIDLSFRRWTSNI